MNLQFTEPHSYRDLPLRLLEYGTCHRYEQSGELIGLMRVRSLNMNVRLHGKGPQGAKPKPEVVADTLAAIRERRAQTGAD